MSLKKIRISELQEYNRLRGSWILVTNDNNVSVKMSLDFLAESSEGAQTAASDAEKAAAAANTAAASADSAASSATDAAGAANTAASAANSAASSADSAATAATTAASTANDSAKKAEAAAGEATEAAGEAADAAGLAEEALQLVIDTLQGLVPGAMELEYPATITLGNWEPQRIAVTLLPESVLRNVIFLCDRASVDVGLDGDITVLGTGTTRVRVIPTCNTALAREVTVTVTDPALRLAAADSLRLASDGTMRLT